MTARAFRTNQIKLDSQLVNLDESSQASPLLNEPSHPYCIDRLLILHCMTSPFCAQNISFEKKCIAATEETQIVANAILPAPQLPWLQRWPSEQELSLSLRNAQQYSIQSSPAFFLAPFCYSTSRVHCSLAGNIQDYNRNISTELASFVGAARRRHHGVQARYGWSALTIYPNKLLTYRKFNQYSYGVKKHEIGTMDYLYGKRKDLQNSYSYMLLFL